jgi:hypothetical protein
MSCAGKGYGTNPQSNAYLNAQFYTTPVAVASSIYNSSLYNSSASTSFRQKSKSCKGNQSAYPSFTPVVNGLSVTSSSAGSYSLVYVNGSNFLPNGTTFIKFGSYGYLPVTYYSSFNISFVIPLNLVAGDYNVQAVNLYNGNFSPEVNQSYPGNLNFSNSITYTIS